MASAGLHDLHKALAELADAYHNDKITDIELKDKAAELVEEWLVIEVSVKATNEVTHMVKSARDKFADELLERYDIGILTRAVSYVTSGNQEGTYTKEQILEFVRTGDHITLKNVNIIAGGMIDIKPSDISNDLFENIEDA